MGGQVARVFCGQGCLEGWDQLSQIDGCFLVLVTVVLEISIETTDNSSPYEELSIQEWGCLRIFLKSAFRLNKG